jgi:hypothetical protein
MGWVRRQSCPTDKRGSFAILTPLGFNVLAAAAPGHVEGVRRHLFDVLTPAQVDQLGEISAAIRDGLSPSYGDAASCGQAPPDSGTEAPCPGVQPGEVGAQAG